MRILAFNGCSLGVGGVWDCVVDGDTTDRLCADIALGRGGVLRNRGQSRLVGGRDVLRLVPRFDRLCRVECSRSTQRPFDESVLDGVH